MFDLAIVFLLTIFVLAFSLLYGRCQERTFNDRWPPISDDEFVAKCTPGTSRDTALRVRRIISEQLGVPYEQIHPDQSFVNDLHCD